MKFRFLSIVTVILGASLNAVSADICSKVVEHSTATASCPSGQTISNVVFASYGTPTGSCGAYKASSCNASTSLSKVKSACLNKASCSILAANSVFGDPCFGTFKSLAIDVQCSGRLPDMIVSSISMNPASPKAGDNVTFSAVVKNIGQGPTPAGIVTGVSFYVDGTEVSWSGYYSSSIAPGASVTVTANGGPNNNSSTYTAVAGAHQVMAFVNDVDRYAESNMNNNKFTSSFNVASATSPTPTPQPTATPSPTPVSTPPPSSGYTAPTLVNPVSPMSYGAKCDGVTDDTAAFRTAINTSDVLVPAGLTCVINGEINFSVSNRHIQCGAGTVLKQAVMNSDGHMLIITAPSGQHLTGDSIVGCYFLGTNTVAPQANWNNEAEHFNIPVETVGMVDNFFLAGNTFDRFWGQSMFQTYDPVNAGSGDQIIYNTFKSCGYYGPVFDAHTNGLIANNTMIDCAAGVENDNASQASGGNIIESNTSSCVYGYGGPDMGSCAMITGGVAGNADYSTNIVRNNSVSGVSSSAGFQGARPSMVIIGAAWGEKPAQYINNTCANGCVIEH